MDNILNKKATLMKKYKRATAIYVVLSVTLFILAASLTIFNLFAIRFNPASNDSNADNAMKFQKYLFVVIIVLSAVSSFISGIMAIYTFRKSSKNAKTKIEKINAEKEKFKNNEGDYETATNKEKQFMRNVVNIYND